jgi:hypothetical protein
MNSAKANEQNKIRVISMYRLALTYRFACFVATTKCWSVLELVVWMIIDEPESGRIWNVRECSIHSMRRPRGLVCEISLDLSRSMQLLHVHIYSIRILFKFTVRRTTSPKIVSDRLAERLSASNTWPRPFNKLEAKEHQVTITASSQL